MEYKTIQHLRIPAIGLGTWGIGGTIEADYSNDSASIDSVKHAIELGYTHIDTAELYGAGHTEELVGSAIKGFNRQDLIITSKVFKTNLRYSDVISACKKSLNRLQTDYIDIYLIHAPNPDIPLKETVEALDSLTESGLVKYIGVSNFSVDQVQEAQNYSKNRIMANQIPYNLATRNKCNVSGCVDMESEVIPYCQHNDIFIMAYRPIERGALLKPGITLNKLAEKYQKTEAQIVLNWLISKQNIVTIPKSTDTEHLKENLGAVGWRLSGEDMRLLDSSIEVDIE
jgi:diketogulonate reductase-like aldo/keto reductase